LERRINAIKKTALMRAREYMSSVEVVNWRTAFLKNTLTVEKKFEDLEETVQAQILEWESNPYKVIGT
jgi:hypothetical protein